MPNPPFVYDGPNAGLVNEVIACAFGDAILRGMGPQHSLPPSTIITDMRAAVDAAGGTGPRGLVDIEY
jgi:hypothetical protein